MEIKSLSIDFGLGETINKLFYYNQDIKINEILKENEIKDILNN